MHISDEIQMRELGARLIRAAHPGTVITLKGDLGTGKTTLVRGALEACGVTDGVRSPTYTLIEYYALDTMTLVHFDLYRLADAEELEYLGYRDYLNDETLCFIEWPEKAQGFLQGVDMQIELEYSDDGRKLRFKPYTMTAQKLLDRLKT